MVSNNKKDNIHEELEQMDIIPIIKEMNILYDGKQFMVRLPKEIVDFFKIQKGDVFEFNVDIKKQGSINTFEIKKE